MEKKTSRRLLKLLYAALGLLAGWVFLRWGLSWVLPFLIALLLAALLERPVLWLHKRVKLPRWAGSALCTLALFGLFSVIVYLLVSRLIYEVGGILKQLPEWMEGLPDLADRFHERVRTLILQAPVGMQDFLNNSVDRIITEGVTIPEGVYKTVGGWVTGIAGALPNLLLFLVTGILSTFFISSDYPRVKEFLLRQLPEGWRGKAENTRDHMKTTLGKWLRAQGILIALTFIQLCVGMLLLEVDYPLTVAAAVAFVDALPVLGLGIVLLPWAGVAFLVGNTPMGFGLVILFTVCSLTRSFAEPKLVGDQIGLHPVLAMLSMYVGFKTFGVLGMILFPILAVLLKQMQEWGYIKIFKT